VRDQDAGDIPECAFQFLGGGSPKKMAGPVRKALEGATTRP
jgi:hypothetical protein